jgi:hypothetical protein
LDMTLGATLEFVSISMSGNITDWLKVVVGLCIGIGVMGGWSFSNNELEFITKLELGVGMFGKVIVDLGYIFGLLYKKIHSDFCLMISIIQKEKMMEYLRSLLLKYFKKILFTCIVLTCLLYFYCLPLSCNEFFEIIRGSLLYIGFSIIMYFSVVLNCFTGAYEFFKKASFIKYSIFIMLGSFFVFMFIIGFVSTIMTRNFKVYSFTIPALIGAYIGGKSVDYIDKKMKNNQ